MSRTKVSESKPLSDVIDDIKRDVDTDLHILVSMLVGATTLMLPERYRPREEHIDRIFQPLERIYMRHAAVGNVNPDVLDIYLSLIGVATYAQHIGLVPAKITNSGATRQNTTGARSGQSNNQKPVAQAAPISQPATSNQSGQPGDISGFRTVEGNLAALFNSGGEPIGRVST